MANILQHLGRQSRERSTNVLEALRLPLGTNTSGGQRSDAKATLTGQHSLKVVPVVGQRNVAGS